MGRAVFTRMQRTSALSLPDERPIFVATDGRRARWLRYSAAAAVVLACLWLAGLSIGLLGFGHLPGLSLPTLSGGDDKAPGERAGMTVRVSSQVSQPGVAETPIAQRVGPTHATPTPAPRRAAAAQLRPDAEVRTPPPAAGVSQPAQPSQQVQPPVRQGWARRGSTTPPGQSQTQPQRPVTPPGQTRRRNGSETTTPLPPQPAPLPPGQQKKTEPPPPKG